MATKNNGLDDLELHTRPLQHEADGTSVSDKPSQEEIRLRAYEIYIERGLRSGNELDDWLRAERELQRVALFIRDWNRPRQAGHPDSDDRD